MNGSVTLCTTPGSRRLSRASRRLRTLRVTARTAAACAGVAVALIAASVTPSGPKAAAQGATTVWTVDNLARIGGHAVTVVGTPRVVTTAVGDAVEFNGTTDGLFLGVNPLEGLRRFTIEALVQPAAEGPVEQRFVHVQDSAADNRALLELRLSPDATWCLDTFLRFGSTGLTLIDRAARHSAGAWHTVSLSYDGQTMVHFVNGVREQAGEIVFGPMGSGRTSLGVRQNKVSWFKGRVRLVRISPEALPPEHLLRVPAR